MHSVLGVLYAGYARPDILHIHAIGPAIVTPLARLLGLKVIVTNHGPDYDRDKWGSFAQYVLRVGERLGMKYSNARIVISKVIDDLVRANYGRDSELIPNGVTIHEPSMDTDHLARFGLLPGRYFLHVGRMVPEKRQLDLIEAYRSILPNDWQLAIAGRMTEEPYSISVREAAREAGVVLTGFVKGAALEQLYSHAGAFVLPSSHEGLPIAMLEALSYGLPVLASDIPANLAVGLEPKDYFPLGDIPALARRPAASQQAIAGPGCPRNSSALGCGTVRLESYCRTNLRPVRNNAWGPEMKPTFIGLGGQKCASSWLYTVFNDHPDAFVSTPKELNYFSAVYDRGHQWYESHFTAGAGRAAVGEISPSYLPDRDAPARAHAYNPDFRILVALRDPVERAYSNHLHNIRLGYYQGADLSFEAGLANNPMYVEQSRYAKHLRAWLEHFPPEQMLIVLQEEIAADPQAQARRVYEFLEHLQRSCIGIRWQAFQRQLSAEVAPPGTIHTRRRHVDASSGTRLGRSKLAGTGRRVSHP